MPRTSEEAIDKLRSLSRPRKASLRACDNSQLKTEVSTRKPPTIRFGVHRKTFTNHSLNIGLPKKTSAKRTSGLEIPVAHLSAEQTSQRSEELFDNLSTDFWTYRPVHEPLSHGVPFPYDVSKTKAATNTELTSPGCATPVGFLNLLAFHSALIRTALFHAESVLGVEALRGFSLPVAATAFAALCPFSLDRTLRAPLRLRSEKRGVSNARHDTVRLGDSCTWEVRSRRDGVTQPRRPFPSQPSCPFEDFSP